MQLWPALAPARLWLALAEAKIEPELGLIDKGWLLLGEEPTSPRLIKDGPTPHPVTKDCPETLEASGKWWYFGGAQPVALQLEDKTATFWVWSVEGRCFASWEAFPYDDTGESLASLHVPDETVEHPAKQAREKVKWKGATLEFELTIKQATMRLVSGPLEDRVSKTVSWATVGCEGGESWHKCSETSSLEVETDADGALLVKASYSYSLDYGKGAAPDTRDATRHVRWPVGGVPEEVCSEDRSESTEAAVGYGSDSKSYDQRRVLYLAGGRLTHRREGSKDDGWKESQTETGKGETCRVETKTRKSTWSWTFEPGTHPKLASTLAKATPTSVPTSAPTSVPASAPTALPKASPTTAPTTAPTSAPTKVNPTTAPTTAAAATSSPTTAPTKSFKAAQQVAEVILGAGDVDTSKTTREPKDCKTDSD